MKQKGTIFLLLIISLTSLDILGYGQNTGNPLQKRSDLIKLSSSWLPSDTDFCYLNYIENKGQWPNVVCYQTDFHGGRLFLENNAMTYVFYPPGGVDRLHPHEGGNPDDYVSCTLIFQAIRMEFANSKNATIIPSSQREFYNNYYTGNDPSHWVSQANAYGKVCYNELYHGISAKVFSRNTDVRYDFIVSPNADPSQIKLRFTGQNGLAMKEGKLVIKTEIGDIEEAVPFAYQMIDGQKVKVNCNYVLGDNEVSFAVDNKYNKALPLIIDPTLVFATFTGSTADNWGMTAAYDALGNGYTSGIGFGVGYPVTPGAFQLTFQGGGTGGGNNWPYPDNAGFDIVVSKFNPTGTKLLFSTYLGGSDNEEPSSLVVDGLNNLIVFGRSYSTNFPTTVGAFSTHSSGGADLIISKFNPTGTALLASTYVGGSGDDGVNGSALENVLINLKFNYADDDRGNVYVDNSNNIYISSCTSSTNFPTTPGAYRTTPYGMQDGCVFKMDPSLTTMMWGTYLGGSNNDAAYNLTLNSKGEVYVTGGTESNNFPTTAGVIKPTYGGHTDGFLCHLSADGSTLINSTYIGTSGYDQSYFVQTDKHDNVYVYGQTSGAYPITPGVYSVPNSGQFIHEMNPTLSGTVFSTEFGAGRGAPDISPSAFLVDNCQNIYVAGWGGPLFGLNAASSSTFGLPVTANAFKSTTSGSDFYFMVLQYNATTLWYATFFGGTNNLAHVDGGTSRFDKSGIIYQAMCAGCGGVSDIPTTPGAWSATNNSPNCNNAIVKFQVGLLETVASYVIQPFVVAGCAPYTATFDNTTSYGKTFEWYFGDGTSSSAASATHTYTTPGYYNVELIAVDSATCNIVDTAHSTVRVDPPVTMNPIPGSFICIGDSINLDAVATAPKAITYSWTPTTGVSNPTVHNPTVSPSTSTEYIVIAQDSFCSASDTISIQVFQNSTKIVPGSPQLCLGDSIQLSADNTDASYLWSTGQTTSSIWALSGGPYTLSTVDGHGCKGGDNVNVTPFSKVPLALNDTSICIGFPADLKVDSGNYVYQWTPSAPLNKSDIFDPVAAKLPQTTTFTVTIINGPCISTGSETVNVEPLPTIKTTADSIMIFYGQAVTLLANGDPGWFWYPSQGLSCSDCPSPLATVDTNTKYYVKVYNKEGCYSTDSVDIEIAPTFYVPDAFTPNGDGLNDVFRPKFVGYKSVDVYIFNRWGERIAHWNTLDGGWDGTRNGVPAQEDVYVYSITAVGYTGKAIQKIGNVTLLR